MTDHRAQQIKVINAIEEQVHANALKFSTITPVEDFENDSRMCLTSVHLPHEELTLLVLQSLVEPLRTIEPDFYYYDADSLHMTIKNIRVISDPPLFDQEDTKKAQEILSKIIPSHKKFNVYFYRLLLFPNNLSLIGTTDPELDEIIFDLNKELKNASIPDDKVYVNSKHFFSNMSLTRFNTPPSKAFIQKVQELSNSIDFRPYTVDRVALLSCNAVLKKRKIIGEWDLGKNS